MEGIIFWGDYMDCLLTTPTHADIVDWVSACRRPRQRGMGGRQEAPWSGEKLSEMGTTEKSSGRSDAAVAKLSTGMPGFP
jgi:hypothetical protein